MYLHSLVFLFLYYLYIYIYVYVLSSIHISWISSYQPLGLSNAWAMKTSHEKSYVVDAMKIPCTRLQKISSFKLLGVNFISALYAWYIFILVTRYIDYIGINAYNSYTIIHHFTSFRYVFNQISVRLNDPVTSPPRRLPMESRSGLVPVSRLVHKRPGFLRQCPGRMDGGWWWADDSIGWGDGSYLDIDNKKRTGWEP